ncbi:uncharacterized protein DDB_G0292186 isoform X3 [Hydra vulgaris]|uniref:uncharacterized protein DDB_G0292186 isoform X3 n=1 Tax=Hydra vulgaris TaxID=6087 RepID=UPI001F5FB655|nr:uncharacterized protein DDB_G0292186-like isoform X3 [Hydra vulgaris]
MSQTQNDWFLWIDYWAIVHIKYIFFYDLKDWQMQKKTFIGCIDLGLMAKCVAGKMKKHGFLFYLNTSKETFLFKVQSNEQRHRWFKAINESAAKSNKIDSQSNELTHQNLSFIQSNPTVDTNLYVTDEKNVESNETNEANVESKVSAPIQVNSSVNSKPLNIINVLPYNEETNNINTNNASCNTIEENVIPNNTMLNNLSNKNNQMYTRPNISFSLSKSSLFRNTNSVTGKTQFSRYFVNPL